MAAIKALQIDHVVLRVTDVPAARLSACYRPSG